MGTWRFSSCPRCRCDMFLEKDEDGWYELCLQCSYRKELASIYELEKEPDQREKKKALTGGKPQRGC